MKRILASMFALLSLAACNNLSDEENLNTPKQLPIFQATIEDSGVSKENSRAYIDDAVRLRWNENDEISLFYGDTYNLNYVFAGKTGDNSGNFKPGIDPGFYSGNDIDNNVAVYPYKAETKFDDSKGAVIYTFPEEQNYASGSVGLGANVMVATTKNTDDKKLIFRNAVSYLCVKLYGECQVVSSIEVKGNNGEALAGEAAIYVGYNEDPETIINQGSESVTLNCGDGVIVGETDKQATSFWIVIPPQEFTKGFTVTVNGTNGESEEFKVDAKADFPRNVYNTMTRKLTQLADETLYGADVITALINGTRTYLDSNGTTTYWLAGDKVGIFTESGGESLKFTAATASDAYSGTFRGTLNGQIPLYAYYPYNPYGGDDPSAVKVTLSSEQSEASFGANDIKASTSRQRSVHTTFDFASVLSLITFRINAVDSPLQDYTLKSITLRAKPVNEGDSAPVVAGNLTIDLTNRNATTFAEDGTDYVTHTLNTPKALSSGQIEVPVLINPAAVKAGTPLEITVQTEEGPYAVITRSASKNYVANTRYTLTSNFVNLSSANITYYGIYEDGNPLSTLTFTQSANQGKLLKSSLFTGANTSSYYTNSTTAYDIECTYNETEGVWEGEIPYLYDFSGLVASFTTVDSDVTVKVDGVEQTSGITPNDFNNDLTYIVEKSDGTYQEAKVRLRNTGLPVVTLTGTVYSKETNFDDIEGSTKMNIDGTEYTCGLRLRGNSTQVMPKKPYAIKLDSGAEILGMPKHKRWVFLANWLDRTMLRNDIAFYLARQTGAWAPNGKPVELVLNGVHVGNYYLCEQIKIDEDRVNIADKKVNELSVQTEDAAGAELGYLLECDQASDNTEIYFRVTSPVQFYVYIKDPGDAESGTVGYSYIQKYFSQIGTALSNKNWSTVASLIDYQSFVDHWLFSEITENQESKHPKSFYMHKDAGGKLKAGPAWDYDWATFIDADKINAVSETSSTAGDIKNGYTMRYTMWYQYLFDDPEFVTLVKERWATLKSSFYTSLTYLDQRATLVKKSDIYNHAMWPIKGMIVNSWYTSTYGFPNLDENLSHDAAIDKMRTNINARIEWLDTQINNL